MNPTIEAIRAWISTGALLGLLGLAGRLYLQNRRLTLASKAGDRRAKVEDRQGYGALIETLTKEVTRLSERVETLEKGKEQDHRLILELVGQLNRNQAVAILSSQNVSSELRQMMDGLVGSTTGAAQ